MAEPRADPIHPRHGGPVRHRGCSGLRRGNLRREVQPSDGPDRHGVSDAGQLCLGIQARSGPQPDTGPVLDASPCGGWPAAG